jgi:hypothetical protein
MLRRAGVGRRMRRPGVGLCAVRALAVPLAGCGESKEAKAEKTVCAARAEIETKVTALKAITPSVATLPQYKTDLTAIAENLKKITTASKELAPSRRKTVEQATDTFETEVSAVASNLASSLSVSNAETELKKAVQQLATSYTQALAPLQCS